MKKPPLNETVTRVYKILLERFGEPIGDAPGTAGAPDERADEVIEPDYIDAPMCPACEGEYCIDGDEPGTYLCHDCGCEFTDDGEVLNEPELMPESNFSKLSNKLGKKGAKNPDALAASIGRKKLGQKEMTRRSVAGRKKAAKKK